MVHIDALTFSSSHYVHVLLANAMFHHSHVLTAECVFFHRSELKSVSSYKQLQLQLQQTQQLADNYREQCVKMEQELCQYKEAADSSRDVFAQKSEKMSKRLDLMNKRYEALEERRRLEVEGYKTDIKLLRQRLKEVEKQLYKASALYYISLLLQHMHVIRR